MGIMDKNPRASATSPILGPRKKPRARPRPTGIGPDVQRLLGDIQAVTQRVRARPSPAAAPRRFSDAELLATGRTGADLEAYQQRRANAAPGGASAGAALMARKHRGRVAALSRGYGAPPGSAGRALVGAGPGTQWQPDLMKQITASTNVARGIAPGAAGNVSFGAPNLFTYPEGGQSPGAAQGRYIGPGAIRPGADGQAVPAGPDLQAQARRLGWRPGPMARPATPQDVAGAQTQLLQTQAEGAQAGLQQAVAERTRAIITDPATTPDQVAQFINGAPPQEQTQMLAGILADLVAAEAPQSVIQWFQQRLVAVEGGTTVPIRPEDLQGLPWLTAIIRRWLGTERPGELGTRIEPRGQ